MKTEIVRKAFEAFSRTHYFLCEKGLECDDGEYVDTDMQLAWETWQSSYDIPVVLPDPLGKNVYGLRPSAWLEYKAGYNEALTACRKAVQSRGLKVSQ